jgi:hypothetical protein
LTQIQAAALVSQSFPEQAEHFASDSGGLAILRVTLQPVATKFRRVSTGSSR